MAITERDATAGSSGRGGLGLRELVVRLLGRPGDWLPARPRRPRLRPSLSLVGPVLIVATTAAAWFSVSGAQGRGNTAFGLFVGLASIVLMAWSFLLAVRVPLLEPLFGGLDRVYTAHRWSGMVAVVAMFLHTSNAPNISGGIEGASVAVASSARDLAGVAQVMLYILVGLSILRWIPYRWWRWTHKLLGVPFAFASWHVWTSSKTFANTDAWGLYFAAIMVIGLTSWVVRIVGRDLFARGASYRVSAATDHGSTLELALAPVGRALSFRAGQFAVVKLALPGLREPHVFTIASSPAEGDLRFFVRDLGDWTSRLPAADVAGVLVGAAARVEGPYGRMQPLAPAGSGRRVVWVAGGVGITPFLSAIGTLAPAPSSQRPTLLYCVRELERATAIEVLRTAVADGRINLVPVVSGDGARFSADLLRAEAGDLAGVHVAACGPLSLISSVEAAARAAGAHDVETEDFDLRSGVGPDLSRWLDDLYRSFLSRRKDTSLT